MSNQSPYPYSDNPPPYQTGGGQYPPSGPGQYPPSGPGQYPPSGPGQYQQPGPGQYPMGNPAGQYQQPGPPVMAVPAGYAVMATPTNGMGVGSLVLGIIALVLSFFGFFIWWLTLPLGLIGLILGAIGMRRPYGKGMAIAGLVLSIIAVVISASLLFIFLAALSAAHAILNP